MSVLVEFRCPTHEVFELLVPRPVPDDAPCPQCGATSPWTPSAVKTYMPVAVVVTGGSNERPPHALDTRPLADGMPAHKWAKREREKARVEARDKTRKELL